MEAGREVRASAAICRSTVPHIAAGLELFKQRLVGKVYLNTHTLGMAARTLSTLLLLSVFASAGIIQAAAGGEGGSSSGTDKLLH